MSIQNTVVRKSDLTENRLQAYSKQEEMRLLKVSTRAKEGTKEQKNKQTPCNFCTNLHNRLS